MGRKKVSGGKYRPALPMSREAKDAFADWCDNNDAEMTRTISRVALWFVKADPLVQAAVLGRVVPRIANAHAAALHKLADEIDGGEHHVVSVTKTTTQKPGAAQQEKGSLVQK